MGPEQPINSDCCGGCHQTDVSSHDTMLMSGKGPHTDTDTHTHTHTHRYTHIDTNGGRTDVGSWGEEKENT